MFPDPDEKVRNYSRPSIQSRVVVGVAQARVVVGVALRGVHALAISAKGYEGVGPVFKIDTTAEGGPQAEKGKVRKRRVNLGTVGTIRVVVGCDGIYSATGCPG